MAQMAAPSANWGSSFWTLPQLVIEQVTPLALERTEGTRHSTLRKIAIDKCSSWATMLLLHASQLTDKKAFAPTFAKALQSRPKVSSKQIGVEKARRMLLLARLGAWKTLCSVPALQRCSPFLSLGKPKTERSVKGTRWILE